MRERFDWFEISKTQLTEIPFLKQLFLFCFQDVFQISPIVIRNECLKKTERFGNEISSCGTFEHHLHTTLTK